MIKINRGAEASPGVWEYRLPSLGLSGASRQPLLDACRQIKSLGGFTGTRAGCSGKGRTYQVRHDGLRYGLPLWSCGRHLKVWLVEETH